MIVVDLGCKAHGNESSIPALVARFKPEILFGFDPYPELGAGLEMVGGTLVVATRAAAWIRNDTLRLAVDGSSSNVVGYGQAGRVDVPAFDFASWLELLPEPPVVKMDIEGSEYPILLDLAVRQRSHLIQRLLVEWHPQTFYACPPDWLTSMLDCPTENWDG